MTQGEKNRMIHIRLEEEVHKDLRKAAAEEDTSLQELVSRVVSRTVAGGKLVEVAVISGDLPEGAHSVTVTMQDGDEDADMASLRVRFQEVERSRGKAWDRGSRTWERCWGVSVRVFRAGRGSCTDAPSLPVLPGEQGKQQPPSRTRYTSARTRGYCRCVGGRRFPGLR